MYIKKLLDLSEFFYKIISLVPKECLSKLYYAFVHPYISYGIEIYANCCKTSLDQLIKANNKILRILLNKKLHTPVIELYREFNVLPISLLHESKLLHVVYKSHYSKHLLPEIFRQYFVANQCVHYHNTRSKINMHISSVNSTFGQRCCTYRGSKYWNNLPIELRNCSNYFSFTKQVKQFLLNRDDV